MFLSIDERSPGKKDPHVNSSLLLSLGTVFFVLGSILLYIGDDLLTGFLPPFVGSFIFYLCGLMLYLINTGKPSYVGRVLKATEAQIIFVPQQPFQVIQPFSGKQLSNKELEANGKLTVCKGADTALPL